MPQTNESCLSIRKINQMFISSLLIKHSLKPFFGVRYDGCPAFPYWRSEDLGIEEKRFSFMSGKWRLRGSKYYLKGSKPKALVIFFHGLGDGRASYIKEISLLVKEGYLVYAYDNTGCMESEGTSIVSFDQTLKDQRAFFKYLESDEDSKGLRRFSIGHSWGGFGAMMSCKKEYKIEKCVSMAGFCRTIDVLVLRYGKKCNSYIKAAMKMALKNLTGKDANKFSIDEIFSSSAEVLYIYGEKDKLVTKEIGFDLLNKAFKNDRRIHFLEVKNVGHSVFREPEAESYVGSLLKKGLGTINSPEGLSMDLEKATKENEIVWSTIFGFYSK